MNDYAVRLHLKTGACQDRTELIKYCLLGSNQFLAIGWHNVYKSDESKKVTISNYADYYYEVKKRYGKVNGCHNIFWYAEPDDLFWTRDLEGNYWICRAKDKAQPHYEENLDIGAIIPVEAYKVGMQVTGQIKAAFNRPNGGTTERIHDELILQYSKHVFNKASGKEYYKINYMKSNILANLPAFDLEELVILYIQIKGNYCVLSNSIAKKSTTIMIECEFISRCTGDKRKAVVQVKGGESKSIDALNYKVYADDGYEVYLYASNVKNVDKVPNIVVIKHDDLHDFYEEYKGILPQSITMWGDVFKD